MKIHSSSCEIEDFVETHLCKMCVILRSRALRIYILLLLTRYASAVSDSNLPLRSDLQRFSSSRWFIFGESLCLLFYIRRPWSSRPFPVDEGLYYLVGFCLTKVFMFWLHFAWTRHLLSRPCSFPIDEGLLYLVQIHLLIETRLLYHLVHIRRPSKAS